MSQDRNIQQQIDELQRELAMRAGVYPGMISRGKLRQSEADEHNARLRAAIATLTWCRDNREAIAAARKALAATGGAS